MLSATKIRTLLVVNRLNSFCHNTVVLVRGLFHFSYTCMYCILIFFILNEPVISYFIVTDKLPYSPIFIYYLIPPSSYITLLLHPPILPYSPIFIYYLTPPSSYITLLSHPHILPYSPSSYSTLLPHPHILPNSPVLKWSYLPLYPLLLTCARNLWMMAPYRIWNYRSHRLF